MTDAVIVRMKHIRAAYMCSSGARAWFKRHKLDWNAFLKDGLPVEAFEATGDAMAIKLAKVARNGR